MGLLECGVRIGLHCWHWPTTDRAIGRISASFLQVSAYCCKRPLVVVLIVGFDISVAHRPINATVHRACCCVWRQRLAYGTAIARA